jgi:hypothetical protein
LLKGRILFAVIRAIGTYTLYRNWCSGTKKEMIE